MYINLNTGAIGIRATLSEALEMAQAHGFAGVDFNIAEVAQMVKVAPVQDVRDLFARTGCRPGVWGLPVDWRGETRKWEEDLGWLRQHAALAREIDASRVVTVVIPFSEETPFKENYAFHVQRLKPVAEILQEHGCSLGLEFIGPKTLRNGKKYEFIHTMDGALELCADLGPNTGLLLDLWHLYTSHGVNEDVRRLSREQVVAVHVNDAPEGIPVDEQLDLVRRLPGETGILDIAGFLKALEVIGYDGPVTAEPFSERVNKMTPEEALRETASAMQKVWRAAGLA